MPKLKNVTMVEIEAIKDKTEDVLDGLHDIVDRIEKGYSDELAEPASLARHFNAVARAAQNMVMVCLIKLAMQEQQREIERLVRAQVKAEAE